MRAGIFAAMAVLMTAAPAAGRSLAEIETRETAQAPAAGRPTLVIDRTARASVFDDGATVRMVVTGECTGAPLSARLAAGWVDPLERGITALGAIAQCRAGRLEVQLETLPLSLDGAAERLELVVRAMDAFVMVAAPQVLRVEIGEGLPDWVPDVLLVPLDVRIDW